MKPLPSAPHVVFCGFETFAFYGGIQQFNQRFLLNLGERLAARGQSVRALLLRDHEAILPEWPGVEISGQATPRALVASLSAGLRRPAELLILGHVNLLPLALLVRARRPLMPILLIVHGDEVWNDPQFRLKRWFEPALLKLVTRVVSVSAFTASVMQPTFRVPPTKFRFLPNAVDALAGGRAADPSRRQEARILTVTRLGKGDRRKNVDKMLHAVAALRREIPGLRYRVIGDGALREELQALAATLGVADIVEFAGRVDARTLDAAYMEATIFALPSDKEGFGIVYLEAWQWGLPVICSEKGAPREVVSDAIDGLVVATDGVDDIVAACRRLLKAPGEAHEMGEAGRRKVDLKYLNASFRGNLDRILDEFDA